MRREIPSIAAMGILLVSSQLVAIALSPLFAEANFQAFPSPQDVTNTVVYLIMILVFTAVILGLRHRDPRDLLRHSSRGPLVDRPRVLRRVGRLPHEAHDHARRRTHESAAADPPRHPEAGGLFVPRPEEPQDAARQWGGTRGDVRRPRRPHHPRHPRGL